MPAERQPPRRPVLTEPTGPGRGDGLALNFVVPRRWTGALPLRSGLPQAEGALQPGEILWPGEETARGRERRRPSSPERLAGCGGCATFPRWALPRRPLPRPPRLPVLRGRSQVIRAEPLRMRPTVCL